MEESKLPYSNIDEYIAQYPPEVQARLQTLRQCIHETAPEATEKISYAMPTFYLKGNLVHFACFKHHIGLYPGASGVEAFLPELGGYKTSKGAIQLPMDKPLPLELVRRIVRFRVAENTAWAEEKKKQAKRSNNA